MIQEIDNENVIEEDYENIMAAGGRQKIGPPWTKEEKQKITDNYTSLKEDLHWEAEVLDYLIEKGFDWNRAKDLRKIKENRLPSAFDDFLTELYKMQNGFESFKISLRKGKFEHLAQRLEGSHVDNTCSLICM